MFSNFDQVFQNTVSAYGIINHELRVIAVNAAYCDLVGRPANALIGQLVFDLFPETPARQDLFTKAFNTALAGTAAQVDEMYYSIPDKDTPIDRWWTVYCTPIDSVDRCFLCHIEDVSEVVQSRQKHDLYAAELQHRVGNVLNVVQVLARRTGQTVQDHDDFLAAFDDRIAALGRTYAHLSGENWNGMSLRDIVDQQLHPALLVPPQSAVIDGPHWPLSVMHAQTFAMAMHELVVNAVKAGAWGQPAGRVQVTWGRSDDGSDWFEWVESGLHGLKPPVQTGFGTQMLLIFLPSQLGGTAQQDFTPTGMHYRLTIPVDVAAQASRM